MKSILLAGAMTLAIAGGAQAATFGRYECTMNCSGHEAGYAWAIAKNIVSEIECERIVLDAPNRTSFYEGCLTWVEDQQLVVSPKLPAQRDPTSPQRSGADSGPLWPLPLAAAVLVVAAWGFRFAPALKRWKQTPSAPVKPWKELSAFDKALLGSAVIYLLLFVGLFIIGGVAIAMVAS
jgi:hypothetical protein